MFQVEPVELRHDLGLSELTLQFNELAPRPGARRFSETCSMSACGPSSGSTEQDDNAIDLAMVDQAEEANAQGNWGATVAMLNPWLTPISMLLRTGEAETLGEEIHGRLSVSLDLLGTAYANLGELDAANEVLRLGIQWAGESGKAGRSVSRAGARVGR